MSRYAELTAKVDAFFARVQARHPDDLRCGSGCADCCQPGLTVTGPEAGAIRAELAGWSPARLAALAALLAAPPARPAPRCAALDADDRCAIYAARPLVCRSHGVPIRLRERGLPVIQACHHNFTARGPAAADPDCVLDQATLSTVLLALDRAEADAAGRPAGARVELAALLAEAVAGAPG